ncbi:hypothetical protein HJG60_001703 [Phyllostomus discolor]|uniref:Uncharacterized protein n=1 Tax=Phyllostomus discolor TaxID=89673 RepID=A0A833ZGP3_9CHIR|nr:hypothetical protein HJG60_001703 [Phyllostomus discolor]
MASRREDPLVEEGAGGDRGQGGGGSGGEIGGGRRGEAVAREHNRERGRGPGGGGRRGPRAGLGVLLPAAPGVQHPAGGAAAKRRPRLLGLAPPLGAAGRPDRAGRQEAEPPGGAVRVADQAAATARRGLRALRDPFLQEMREPAQQPGLHSALHSGALGSGTFWPAGQKHAWRK